MERLLRENENRGKTPEQQIREGMTWEPIEEAKAKQRSINAHATKIYTASENFLTQESGRVTDIIARRVGLGSGKTYEKGKEVVDVLSPEGRTGGAQDEPHTEHTRYNCTVILPDQTRLIQMCMYFLSERGLTQDEQLSTTRACSC